eukprot:350388-Chlamydomonas_euryale.AAC.25
MSAGDMLMPLPCTTAQPHELLCRSLKLGPAVSRKAFGSGDADVCHCRACVGFCTANASEASRPDASVGPEPSGASDAQIDIRHRSTAARDMPAVQAEWRRQQKGACAPNPKPA